MPRKGRQVELRHIFPWVAAPYIELLRLLWRIERFLISPFLYLQAWTVSAVFGIIGILLSVALFIPRLTNNEVQASSSRLISRHEMPYIPLEDLSLPPGYSASGQPRVQLSVERTTLRDFDQNERILTESTPPRPKRSSIAMVDTWGRHEEGRQTYSPLAFQPYIRRAPFHDSLLTQMVPEYQYDPGLGDFQSTRSHSADVTVRKTIPRGTADDPLTYLITVSNAGREIVSQATIEEAVSDIQRVIDTDPPAMVSPNQDRLVWELGELLPNETRHLKVTIQPDRHRLSTQNTLAVFSTAPVIAETMVREKPPEALPEPLPEPTPPPVEPVRTPVTAPVRPSIPGVPKLALEFDPPETVRVGEEVRAYYTITNIGTADATGIRLLVEVPPELKHRFGELVEHKISKLAPNESRKALFAALAQNQGRMALNWTLECAELDDQANTEWVAVNPAAARTGTVRSSIPSSEPTPINSLEPTPVEPISPVEPTPNDPLSTWSQPRPTYDSPRTIPARGVPYGPQPAPGSSIPPTIASPFPSSIPHWVDPSAVTEPGSGDWRGREPIVPDLAPEEPMELGPVSPPVDLPDLESAEPATDVPYKSSIPSNSPAPRESPTRERSSIPNGPAFPDLAPDGTVPPGSLPPQLDLNEPEIPAESNAAPEFPSELPAPESEEPPLEGKAL